jgi:hypothetical protein
MDKEINNVAKVCFSRCSAIKDIYKKNDYSILFSHFGELSVDYMNNIPIKTEKAMLISGDKKATIKRIFNILIEGLQNIRLHGEKDVDGNQVSFVNIAKEESYYKISLGNLINNEYTNNISNRIDKINLADQDGQKRMYVDILTNGEISKKGGAGLGFITMAMKSKNKLNFYIDKIDKSLSCFTLDILIDRK